MWHTNTFNHFMNFFYLPMGFEFDLIDYKPFFHGTVADIAMGVRLALKWSGCCLFINTDQGTAKCCSCWFSACYASMLCKQLILITASTNSFSMFQQEQQYRNQRELLLYGFIVCCREVKLSPSFYLSCDNHRTLSSLCRM